MRKKICTRRDCIAFTHCMLVFVLLFPYLKNDSSLLQWAHEVQRDHSWSKVLGRTAACSWKQEFRSYSTRLCQVCCIQAPSCFPTMERTRKLTYSSAIYVGASLPIWLLGKETKETKSKNKKKKVLKVLKKKKFWKQNSQQTGAVILDSASPVHHTADSRKLMWAPISHQLMQLSARHTCVVYWLCKMLIVLRDKVISVFWG